MAKTYRLSARAIRRLAATPPASTNRLRDAFRLAGCRQRDAAEATGIACSNLSRIVNHKRYRTVTIGTAQRLSAFFGAPVDVLFPHADDERP